MLYATADYKRGRFSDNNVSNSFVLDMNYTLIKEAGNVNKLAERTSQMKTFLKEKLTPEEYQKFLGSLFMNGVKVARASGGGVLGLGDKISAEEKRALAAFAAIFELDLANLSKLFEQ